MATLSQLINAKAIAIGKLAVRATTAAGSGHPTSALSLAHLAASLMRWSRRSSRLSNFPLGFFGNAPANISLLVP